MIWQELTLLLAIIIGVLWWLVHLWIKTSKQDSLWLIDPTWTGDGRKYIVSAQNEDAADHVFLRHVCGWEVIKPGDRSKSKITKLNIDGNGVAVI